jgi:hypothetical protein
MTAAERRWCWIWAAVVMALTTVPYLWCWWQTPPGREFCWVLYGRDDHAVYMAWLRQVADGSFFLRNLFTTDPQGGRLSNLFFFLLGQPVRFLGIEPALVLQIARVGFGALLLVLVYRFAAYFTENVTVRRMTFWLAALAGGLGWGSVLGWFDGIYSLPGHEAVRKLPTDLWQPEGFTFLSVYSTALFAASTCAIVGILCLLLQAERTGQRKWAFGAGVLALLLGNFHSYDIIHVAVAWGLYLLLKSATALSQREEIPWRSWGDAVVCAVIGLPTTLLQYYFYRTDPVFQQRASYETLSPDFSAYALGYGLVLLLALPGAFLMLRGELGSRLKLGQRWMPLAWVIAGFIVAYLPLAFNRKMIMGTHVPLCLLAATAAVALATRLFPTLENAKTRKGENAKIRRKPQHGDTVTPRARTGEDDGDHRHSLFAFSPSRAFAFSIIGRPTVLALIVLLTAPSSVLFVLRDVADRGERAEDLNWFSAYWPQADLKATEWIRRNTPRDAAFFCTPLSGRFIAAAAGRTVYAAHWGETPRFAERVGVTVQFFQQPMSAEERLMQLKTCATDYVYQGTTERLAGQVDLSRDPGLEKVYDADGVTIYRVKREGVRAANPSPQPTPRPRS